MTFIYPNITTLIDIIMNQAQMDRLLKMSGYKNVTNNLVSAHP